MMLVNRIRPSMSAHQLMGLLALPHQINTADVSDIAPAAAAGPVSTLNCKVASQERRRVGRRGRLHL